MARAARTNQTQEWPLGVRKRYSNFGVCPGVFNQRTQYYWKAELGFVEFCDYCNLHNGRFRIYSSYAVAKAVICAIFSRPEQRRVLLVDSV